MQSGVLHNNDMLYNSEFCRTFSRIKLVNGNICDWIFGKHIFSIIRMLPIGHKWLTNPTYQSLVVEEEAIFMSKTQYPRPPFTSVDQPYLSVTGGCYIHVQKPNTQEEEDIFLLWLFLQCKFSQICSCWKSEQWDLPRARWPLPQATKVFLQVWKQQSSLYGNMRTPAHSFSFHNDRTDRGMTKKSWVIPHETGQGWRGWQGRGWDDIGITFWNDFWMIEWL